MSAEVAARLRSLAQDHHDGRLDLAAYRALRAPLLDSLASYGPALPAAEITQPRGAPAQALRDAITRPGRPHVVSSGSSSSASAGSRAASSSGESQSGPLISSQRLRQVAIAITIAIGVVVVVGLSTWLARGAADHGAADGRTTGVPVERGGGVRSLLESFAAGGDWSDARITALNAALLELGANQIAAVAPESWFQQFVDELRRRLKEQQALSPTRLTADNSPLAALAVTVGLDLNSPDAALHVSPLPAPPPVIGVVAGEHAVARVSPQARGDSGSGSLLSAVGTVATPGATDVEHGVPAAAPTPAGADVAHGVPGPAPVAGAVAPSPNVTADTHADAQPATTTAEACRLELVRSRRPLCHDSIPGSGDGPEMALVPAGAFEMGSTAASEEEPVHHVTLAQPFAVSVYEVSQGEFKQFCEATHRTCAAQPWAGDDYPVVNVSWDDARAYTDWLTSVTQHHYSLPTEAQWEYAARAGSAGLYPNGSATLSPTDANYSMLQRQTVAVRRSQRFNANAFRLLHTVGNVREWVEDAWTRNFAGAPGDGTAVKSAQAALRVVRGGSYADGPARLRLSTREGLAPATRDVTTGFRIVRELP